MDCPSTKVIPQDDAAVSALDAAGNNTVLDTADLSRKKPTVGRVPGYVGLPEGRARPGASRSKIVVNFYRTKSNNDDPLND